MPVFPFPRRLIASSLLGLLLVSACQPAPGLTGAAVPRLQLAPLPVPAADRAALTIALRPAARRVTALASEVHQVAVTVRTADGAEYRQALGAAAPASGPLSATFADLPQGRAVVTVDALDAVGLVIGHTQASLALQAGQLNSLSLSFELTPVRVLESPLPSPSPTSLAVTATIIDGPVLPGAPSPVPTPKAYLGQERLKLTDFRLAYDLAVNGAGDLWMAHNGELYKLSQDGMILFHRPNVSLLTSHLVVDGQDHVWALDQDSLKRLSPNGVELDSHPIPSVLTQTSVRERHLAADGDGQLWLSGGRHVVRMAPDGTVLDVIAMQTDCGAVAVDRGTGTAWVVLETQGKLARFSAQGAALGTLTATQTGDSLTSLALDAAGDAWVVEAISGRVVKVGADGAHRASFAGMSFLTHVISDRTGGVLLAGPATEHMPYFYDAIIRLSPEGRRMGYYAAPSMSAGVVDPFGHLWYSDLTGLVKIAL